MKLNSLVTTNGCVSYLFEKLLSRNLALMFLIAQFSQLR